ncbi:hypothetical protein BJV82DRAFT_582045 [Fennellomyces sp. T-0311]|nr:hypothetical protein BJV82DRAFT_582045 [Fennellomyces sp. T-0311]
MQSYAEVYQRYFDPDRFAPGTPKTMKRELPRASAYQALISLKHKYHCDSKQPLDVNDLPTSAPLFDNNEFLDRAEQVTMDWTLQHPGRTNSPMEVQDETRREAQNLWKIWTDSNRSKNRLNEPKSMPRRASDSVASPGHSDDFDDRRISMPLQQQQNWNGSIPLYDQKAAEPVVFNTMPASPSVPAPAPIDSNVRPPASTFPVASDYPATENKGPVDAGGGGTKDNAEVPADSKAANESLKDNHVGTAAMATAAGAAAGGAAASADDETAQSTASSAQAPWESPAKKINFAEETKDDQIKKEAPQTKNSGGTKERIAEQPELFSQGGLTGTQPVGKIDLKNL